MADATGKLRAHAITSRELHRYTAQLERRLGLAEEKVAILTAALREEDRAFRALLARQSHFPEQSEEAALDAVDKALKLSDEIVAGTIARLTLALVELRIAVSAVNDGALEGHCQVILDSVVDLLPA